MSSCGSTIVFTTPPVLLVDELVKPLRALVGAAGPLAEALDMGVVLFLAVVF